ncbi:MAG: DNA-binding protein [Kosmotogaceae bacterium]
MLNSSILGIGSGNIDRFILARIKKNQDLLRSIKEIVISEKIERGIFISAIGALQKGVFRTMKQFPKKLPVQDFDREFIEINKPLELLSLSGFFCEKEGKPYIHAHFSASYLNEQSKLCTLGGHLIEGNISYIKVTIIIAALKDINMEVKYSKESESLELLLPK